MADTETKHDLSAVQSETAGHAGNGATKTPRVDAARRQQILAELEQLRHEMSSQFTDLTEDEVNALADELVDEAVAGLIKQGRIQYEG